MKPTLLCRTNAVVHSLSQFSNGSDRAHLVADGSRE